MQTAFGTDDEQMESLRAAVAKKIERVIGEGHQFEISFTGDKLKRLQRDVACKTYTAAQAVEELEVTREAIRKKRVKFGLPLLLTEEDLDLIRGDLQKNKAAVS